MSTLRKRADQAHPSRDAYPTLLFNDERIAALHRDNQFRRQAGRFLRFAILLASFSIGVSVGAWRAPDPGPFVAQHSTLYQKAQRLPAGKMSCSLDPHEGCLLCLHRGEAGQVTVAGHC